MINDREIYVIIGAAGSGKRMAAQVPKQFLKIDGRSILEQTVSAFDCPEIDGIILTAPAAYTELCKNIFKDQLAKGKMWIVPGGSERQDSIWEGLRKLSHICTNENTIVLVHDGVRPYVSWNLIERVIEVTAKTGAAIAAVPPKDTIRDAEKGTLQRSRLWCVQTPQGFSFSLLYRAYEKAYAEGFYGTDDAGLVERLGRQVALVEGDYSNLKITTPEDLKVESRIGTGFDVHQLTEGRDLYLGGVKIPYEKGLLGHSDADVLLHALMDAILGAAAAGDIGKLFPDSDEKYRGISSMKLLEETMRVISEKGYHIGNVDATVICEKPKLAPYIEEMRQNIAQVLCTDVSRISIKATTTEKLGFTGRGEGIAAQAVCLLNR